MRYFSLIVLPFLCCVGYADEPVPAADLPSTTQDYEQQIQLLKDQIAKYEGLSLSFDRKAQRLQSRDFSEYRRSLALREKCKDIAEDLKKHLAELEEQRSAK